MDWKEIEKEANRQAKIESLKIFLIGFIIIVALIFSIIAIGAYSEHKSERELNEKIHSYSTISVNGEVFETSEIVDIDVKDNYYANNTVTFSMSDGTMIETQEGSWTLKK